MNLETLVIPIKADTKGFNPAVAGVVAGVAAIVGAMVGAVAATAKWAKDLDTLGDVIDGTKGEIAAMGYIARKSGVDVEKVAKANVILSKSLLKSNGQLDVGGKKLKEYGISAKKANGEVKTGAELTDEIARKYGELATAQERVNFLTDVYGKSGADMIDFFDTLNSEGGIAAVTKKVEALGLALDPGRYEQFNRNLEELKLIGLGIAVGFTEKVMPVLEGVLKWFTDFIPRAKKAFSKGGLAGLFDLVVDELSKLDDKLATAIGKIDWKKLGEKFGKLLDGALAGEVKAGNMPKSVTAFGKAISDFLLGAMNQPDWQSAKRTFFAIMQNLGVQAGDWLSKGLNSTRPVFLGTMNNLGLDANQKLREIAKIFYDRASGWINQAVLSLESAKGALFGKIQEIVDTIRGMLAKVGINVPVTYSVSSSKPGAGKPGNPLIVPKGAHATGGPVWAGTAYNVNELGKPEYFIPAQNGRIEPKSSNQPTTARIDRRDMEMLADMIVEKALRIA